ncbi:MAG: extracellular solute-binding protein [Acetatifactor sp.]|nr:extracellular solute-binding protein [Acetatifactor sp.]
MKRGLWTKVAALVLAVMMSLGLAACSSGVDDDNHSDNGDDPRMVNSGSGKTSQTGKENVYSFQELELLNRNDNVNSMVYQDGKLYLLIYNWGGSGEESNEKNIFGCYIANADGSESSFTELALPEKEESYSWINSTLISGAGYIYAVENSGYENTSDPDNYVYEDRYFLNCWDMDGSLQWSKRLDTSNAGEYTYCSQLLDGGEGRALIIMGGSRNEALLYSPQGEEISRREINNGIFEHSGMMYTRDDGTLMITFYNEEYTKRFIASYDFETDTLGEQYELTFNDNYRISKGSGTDLLLSDSMGLYTWNVGDAEPKMLMNIVNSDLPANEISNAQIIDDRHFVALYNDLSSWEQKCAYFTYMDPADIQDKEELVLGGVYIGSDIKAKVIAFNKSSDRYRITLKDYSTYNTSEDWTAGQTRLNSDIISGQMPDIMILTDINNYANYVSKGLLADIGGLLKADPELGKLEYLQNVWDAYSVNGKLYVTIPSFSVRTMIAKKALVGEPQSWTMADVEAVVATMPDGAAAFGNMTRYNFIYQMMSYAGRDFIDVETGKCTFNSQSFMDMLEYAKNMPTEGNIMYEEDYSYYENQYRENRSLLYDLYISNIKDSKYQVRGYIGEEISFVGFPSTDSNGSTLSAGNFSFMISAKSGQQDGAWQFVRQFLTEEYQTSTEFYDMPVLKSAFLAKAQEAAERPYWTDENGDRQYYDDTWTVNGEVITLEPFTQEEIDKFCEFICTVNRTAYYNDYIRNIIVEEAEAFFTGQKNVQEVVDIIQSRAQIYVNENR